MKDYLVRGIIPSKNCRVFACQTTQLLEIARQKHGLWPTASAALGRMMSATLMMSAMNKNHEKMTVTMNGNGPIGTMIATTNSDGKIKAFVANPEVHYTYNDTGKLAVGVAVGNEGTLQVIKDMGLKEPFVGTVPLQSGEIGDDFSYYFMISEQTPSVVSVGVLVNDTNEILSSGGFIIQLLPEATEDDIIYIENKMKDFPPVSSLIHDGKTPEDILSMLFDDVEILAKQDLMFECDCSKEQMKNALITVGKDEIQTMINEDHGCEMTCHFCNTKYQFSESELNDLLLELNV
ncbi:MAG: Hsp33 family molecular chaperone HslO [Coprobacillus sp.]|nr:Hsp33 family molecular chaperone HslO [Coprobacillus sp.]